MRVSLAVSCVILLAALAESSSRIKRRQFQSKVCFWHHRFPQIDDPRNLKKPPPCGKDSESRGAP